MHCSINFALYFTEENMKVTVVHYDSEIRINNEPVCCLQQLPSTICKQFNKRFLLYYDYISFILLYK